ncbi:MAG: hypothetical protein E5W21_01665 [Mesorhizobium sp.]|nr:MAG: hypothetical protein E5W21_01665 [Mesorhizobium sp.]
MPEQRRLDRCGIAVRSKEHGFRNVSSLLTFALMEDSDDLNVVIDRAEKLRAECGLLCAKARAERERARTLVAEIAAIVQRCVKTTERGRSLCSREIHNAVHARASIILRWQAKRTSPIGENGRQEHWPPL